MATKLMFIFTILVLILLKFSASMTLHCDLISNTWSGIPYCFFRHVKINSENELIAFGENAYANDKRELIFDNCSFITLPIGMFEYFPNVRTIYTWNSGIKKLTQESFRNAEHLTTIDLTKNQIVNLTSAVFAFASNLEQLELTYNELKLIDGNAFTGLTQLRSLYMDFNQIEILPSNTFQSLIRLETIRLNNNRIKSISHRLFDRNFHLANIYLQENQIEQLNGEKTFSHLKKLNEFDLHNNRIKKFTKFIINAHSIDLRNSGANGINIGVNTKRLTAADNKITFIELNETASMQLQIVDLSNNLLTKMKNLTYCTALTYLDLSHNQINDYEIKSFALMNALEVLKLRNSGLHTIQYGLFSHKQHLQILDISFNQLVEIHFDMFMSLGNLRTLYLDGNNITNMDMSEIRKVFPLLTKIGIAKNNWHCTKLANAIKYLESNEIALNSVGYIKSTENIRGIPCYNPLMETTLTIPTSTTTSTTTTTTTSTVKPETTTTMKRTPPVISTHITTVTEMMKIEQKNQFEDRKTIESRDLNFIVKLMELKYQTHDTIKQIKLIAKKLQDLLDDVRDNK